MDDKIIVSNHAALTAKYGGAGVTKIKKAIDALIAADAKRGMYHCLLRTFQIACVRPCIRLSARKGTIRKLREHAD